MINVNEINKALAACADDMASVASEGVLSLEAQVRAYDLLSDLLECQDYGFEGVDSVLAAGFRNVYESVSDKLESAFDADRLMTEVSERVAGLKAAENEARFEAAAAASLHEFAKDTFDIWRSSGIFARRRALRELRERAGFRLESHRIGNYVAKTFDLMNEAHARFARAQQAVFKADVTYKCKSGTYQALYNLLKQI